MVITVAEERVIDCSTRPIADWGRHHPLAQYCVLRRVFDLLYKYNLSLETFLRTCWVKIPINGHRDYAQ